MTPHTSKHLANQLKDLALLHFCRAISVVLAVVRTVTACWMAVNFSGLKQKVGSSMAGHVPRAGLSTMVC